MKYALAAVLGMLLAGLGIAIVLSIQSNSKFEAECEARGGVPVYPRSDRLCIDPKALK